MSVGLQGNVQELSTIQIRERPLTNRYETVSMKREKLTLRQSEDEKGTNENPGHHVSIMVEFYQVN